MTKQLLYVQQWSGQRDNSPQGLRILIDGSTWRSESLSFSPPGRSRTPTSLFPDEDEPYSGLEQLLRRFRRTRRADGEDDGFWPYELLRRVLNRERVQACLERCAAIDPGSASGLCEAIIGDQSASDVGRWLKHDAADNTLRGGDVSVFKNTTTVAPKSYLRIFALLVLQEKPGLIRAFVDHGVCDDSLPLDIVNNNGSVSLMRLGRPPHVSSSDWFRPHELEHLKSFQWKLITPCFSFRKTRETVPHYDLPEEAVLPWRDDGNYEGKQGTILGRDQGGSGVVRRVKIEVDSLDIDGLDTIIASDPRPDARLFAVKSLRKKNAAAEFSRELEMLKRFGGIQHPHLVTLLATFTHQSRHHFIFPCADLDLDDYWNQKPPERLGSPTYPAFIRWVSAQLRGLAEAVYVIHEPTGRRRELLEVSGPDGKMYGRHGDLKPQNILWFRGDTEWAAAGEEDPARGILVITDLGASAVHSEVSRSNVPNQGLPQTPTYRPPECDMAEGRITRAFDVWTLGCVFLEMASWLLEGTRGRAGFVTSRTSRFLDYGGMDLFYNIQRRGEGEACEFTVKESVFEYIEKLHRNQSCTWYIHELLDLIHGQMLCVIHQERIRSSGLDLRIKTMHRRVLEEPAYAQEPSLWQQTIIERPQPVISHLTCYHQNNKSAIEDQRRRLMGPDTTVDGSPDEMES
ncbi:uncharacterized protein PgNI_04403 [Pyricularia grisea]|uniref:Protein kinase domain-containing protein n=1 Tax=Pyricularia grisea TaxID=148305 RepID=A0A6P8BB39_PYRGI|nr:uncharacterized protein PgNI_04403 [Pyricularia grisea]TLD13051.1 hypothetical protein PgNI_04403 [Pyricularia grisea]